MNDHTNLNDFNLITFQEKIESDKPNKSTFIFEHIPNNTGLILGNSLRRLIIDRTSGISIWGVEISDKNGRVKSKFTSLEGVNVVSIYLILNLKEIVFKEETPISVGENFIFELDINNETNEERIIKAEDFKSTNNSISIVNPDKEIAILSKNSKLKIKIYCRKSIGYQSSDKQKKLIENIEDNQNKDIIILDSNYSPVKNGLVYSNVETVVVGLSQEEEKLSLTVQTDGSVSPLEVLKETILFYKDYNEKILKLIIE